MSQILFTKGSRAIGIKAIFFCILFFLLISFSKAVAITSIKTGAWSATTTWDSGKIPGPNDDVIINHVVTITSGEIAVANKITISPTGKLFVEGKLTLTTDLIMNFSGNDESELVLSSGSQVIVNGSVSLGNKVSLVLSSYFIVKGSLTKQGNASPDLTISGAHIYILGNVDPLNGFTSCSNQYLGTTNDIKDACDYGKLDDLINNDVVLQVPEVLTIIQSSPNVVKVTNLTSSSTCFCPNGGVTLIIGESKTISLLKWYRETSVLSNVTSPSAYTFSANQDGSYYALYKIVDTWYQTNSVTLNSTQPPTASISGNSNICIGSSATLSITLTGQSPWNFTYTDGTAPVTVSNYSGANPYTINVSPVSTKTYTLTNVSNGCCIGTTSGSATVTVLTANVSITGQSTVGQTVCLGTAFNPISVTATASSGSISGYQWYKNTLNSNTGGTSISGATNSVYTPDSSSPGTSYYYCVVNGSCGSVISAVSGAFVTKPNPVITSQPIENTYCSDDNTNFSVVAIGSNLTYQWQTNYGNSSFQNLSDGSPYSGTNSSTLTISSVQKWMTDQNYKYRVIVSSESCPVISSEVRILVGQKPSIYNQPINRTICEGVSTSFDVNSNGTAFQWEVSTDGGINWNNVVNNSLYSGATSRTLSIANGILSMSNFQYRVLVSIDNCNIYSSVVSLTVEALPVISSNPADLVSCVDNDASFSVSATGVGVSYQWQANSGNWYNINDNSNYSNTNSSTLTVLKTQIWQSGYKFRVIVTNTAGCSIISGEALLTVSSSKKPSTPSSILGNNTPCQGENGIVYSVDSQSGATFSWSVPLGWTITSGQGTNSIIVKAGSFGQNGTISVSASNGCSISTESTLSVSVSPQLSPAISIVSSANPVCQGSSVTFTAMPTNGGSSPVFQWKVNGSDAGTNNPTFTYIPVNDDVITCELTSDLSCVASATATSNAIRMTIISSPTASAGSDVSTCASSPVNITAGASATNYSEIAWTSNGTGTFTDASSLTTCSYTPSAADIAAGSVSLTLTVKANGNCADVISTKVLTINPLPAVFNVTGGGSYCSGGSGVEVGLSGSETGVSYQLYRGGMAIGSTVSGTSSAISFGSQTAGTYTIKATNSSTFCTLDMNGTISVTNEDKIAPVISQCPSGETVSCVSEIPAGKTSYQDFINAGGKVTDNCTDPNSLTVTYNDVISPGSACKVTRTYTIKDASGNEATCEQEFTITDGQAPKINTVNNIIVAPDDNSCGATLKINAPTDVTENCSWVAAGAHYEYKIAEETKKGNGVISDIFPEGTTLITWTVTDICGHVSAPIIQTVQVGINLTGISYDNGSTETGSGSGIQPMQTSTHEYFVDDKKPENGYSYVWGLYVDNNGVPGAEVEASYYSLSQVNGNKAEVQVTFKNQNPIPVGNYILSVIKTKDGTTCKKQVRLPIAVQSNSLFDVVLDDLGNQCQAPGGGLATISWNVTFPNVITEPFMFSYSIKLGGTVVATGNVPNITYAGAIPTPSLSVGVQAGKSANSPVVVLYYNFYGVSGNDLARTVEVEIDATDIYQVSEPNKTNNTDNLKINQVPVITFE